ncbi:2-oxoglutarate and iron-dependent oxygenase JMJD4 isoform X3 [Ricinus communis]|uniref:Transcription factor, putative n=1 Tax=Ricinus communis TaxID=3988 RepID=B9RAY2_RICCO|nr:2-oxoglutarate and iron-dependent oxygenase JMJD4 isoform X3 [Ricinus communis]EEF51959.1 transcription factor, putative [Ricinus communis]|eukprot:XP_002511357.1 jmjC domain-containing protein 4 isoform X1 [Ricinus communis]
MGIEIGGRIEKVNGKELSYDEFVERYLSKNQPVVLTGLMDNWRACKDWVTDDGYPNLQFFSTHFGKSRVQVADCGTREFTDQKRVEMTVSEFIDHWIEYNASNHESNSKSLLYLKDWHFVKEYPEYVAYRTPLPFCDDWLNPYLDHYRMHRNPDTYQENNEICSSDYRFVYMGAKGSWTPLHADVFRSYSWSANICGKKKWIFLSPSQCHLVFDRNMKNTVYNIFEDVSETQFPGFKKAIWLECIQNQNEIIFVPSRWYHQVHNLEDTISINHNWFNAYNLSWVWDLLWEDYKEAKEYIEDIRDICDDFEGVCQRNLAANTGMNFIDFFIFLAPFFLANVVQHYCRDRDSETSHRTSKVTRHLAFNLASIQKIALKMRSTEGETGTGGYFLDLKEIVEDPKFLKLYMDMGRIYGMIHEQQSRTNRDIEKAMEDDILDYSFSICTLEDFVKFVDYTVRKLGNI